MMRLSARAKPEHRVTPAMRQSPPPFDPAERQAQLERLLAKREAMRARILELLADGVERYSVEIADQLGVPYRGITTHLVWLRKAGKLTSRHVPAMEIHGTTSGLGRRYYKLAAAAVLISEAS